MFLDIFKKNFGPIGVEIDPDSVEMAQFAIDAGRVSLVAGGTEPLPAGITPYSGQWQRSAIEAIRSLYTETPFKGRNIITAVSCANVFTKEIKLNISETEDVNALVLEEIKKIVPFDSEGALIKHIILDDNRQEKNKALSNVLVMATEKAIVERHLAIFEKVNLNVASVTVWPILLSKCYSCFFGRRRSDAEANVMLVNAGQSLCNVVICRRNKILFARTIQKGIANLEDDDGRRHLIDEVEACIRFFQTGRHSSVVEKIILLVNQNADKRLSDCILAVAKKQSLPAQVGDVLRAVSDGETYKKGIDARNSNIDWTTVFGLGLAGNNL